MLRPPEVLALAAILCAAASPALSQTASCPLNGVAAFNAARAQAYVFSAVSSTAADCEIYRSTSSIVVSANGAADGVCEFLVFGGKPLASGWRIASLDVSGVGVTISTPAQGHGRLLRIPVDAGETKVVSVRKVILKGGPCAQVTEVFD